MSRIIRALSALLLAAMMVVLPVASAMAADAPLDWAEAHVVVHEESGTALLIISGTLPEDAALPAVVELTAPAGSAKQWVGEILGGDLANDPSVTPEVRTEGANDVYRFTLTQSRTAQLEVTAPAGTLTSDGSTTKGTLAWTPTTAVGELTLRFRVPANAQVQPAEGTTMTVGPSGYAYLQRTVREVKAGQTESLELSAIGGTSAPAPVAPAPAASTDSQYGAAVWIVLAVVLAGVFFAGRAVLAKMQTKGTDDDEWLPEEASSAPAKRVPASPAPSAAAGPAPGTAPASRFSARTVIIGLIVIAFVIGAAVALNSGRSAVAVGDTIEMTYAQVDTCTTSNFKLTPPAGVDLEKDGQQALEALRAVVGLGNATLYVKESRLVARYCDSQVQESQVVSALTSAGWTATPMAAPVEEVLPAQ